MKKKTKFPLLKLVTADRGVRLCSCSWVRECAASYNCLRSTNAGLRRHSSGFLENGDVVIVIGPWLVLHGGRVWYVDEIGGTTDSTMVEVDLS